MKNTIFTFFSVLFFLLISGCSTTAPNYSASIDNIEALKKSGDFHAKIGNFTSIASEENMNPISIRGSSMVSPYQNSYATYVGEAIKQELVMAKKMAQNADIELSGVLLKNDINADIRTGHANIKMQLIVKKNDKVNYDRVKSVEHQWDSSFVGAIAIPRAMQEYPVMIQKLLAQFYNDNDFVNALK